MSSAQFQAHCAQRIAMLNKYCYEPQEYDTMIEVLEMGIKYQNGLLQQTLISTIVHKEIVDSCKEVIDSFKEMIRLCKEKKAFVQTHF